MTKMNVINDNNSISSRLFNANTCLQLVGNRKQLAIDMFTLLLSTLPDDQADILTAYDSSDFNELLEKTHKLHGATLYCGVPLLTQRTANLEMLLKKNQDQQVIESAVNELIQAITHLINWSKENDWQALITQAHIDT